VFKNQLNQKFQLMVEGPEIYLYSNNVDSKSLPSSNGLSS